MTLPPEVDNWLFRGAEARTTYQQVVHGDLPNLGSPCHVRILIVLDGGEGGRALSFSRSTFGLWSLLNTLRNNPEFYVRFDVTRAHRQTDPYKPHLTFPFPSLDYRLYAPRWENFRFDQENFDIDQFDEVWLFGSRADDATRLSDAELEVLARWMDAGGGLFAVGDHETLGEAMCARVPRAGTMRKWTIAQGVPTQFGLDRSDTLESGHDADWTFDDESDDVPQRITPRLFPRGPASPPWRQLYEPHPVLCGKRGIIDILPDHPHEGEIIDESTINLSATFNFNGYAGDEYPTFKIGPIATAALGPGGVGPEFPGRPSPVTIAWADVLPNHTWDSDAFKKDVTPHRFGVLGAYNGHASNVGRVFVDATWHHWFDENLTGRQGMLDSDPDNPENPKRQGFLATPQGRAHYYRIQEYHRNVALWLAPKSVQLCMLLQASWGSVIRYPAVEALSVDAPTWRIGMTTIAALGYGTNQCLLNGWFGLLIPELVSDGFGVSALPRETDDRLCLTCPPFELYETYIAGGIGRRLLRLAYDSDDLGAVDLRSIAAEFAEGAKEGAAEFASLLDESLEHTRTLSETLSRLAGEVAEADALIEVASRHVAAPESASDVAEDKPDGEPPQSGQE